MKTSKICMALAAIATLAAGGCNKHDLVSDGYRFAEGQTKILLAEAEPKMPKLPRTVAADSLVATGIYDWVSGFFPGRLWLLFEHTGSRYWRSEAERWTALLEPVQNFYAHHDVGFMMQCSYGNGYRLTHNEAYKPVLVQAARSLCKRFNPKIGSIQSWNVNASTRRRGWQFPVIIDNMMNLELLFNATKLSGDSSFYRIAVTHANTTMRNHFRPDYSCYHVVDYDTATAAVAHRVTAQGFADESVWARGQAWGLYGFTVCYRETRDTSYLAQAQHIAHFIMTNPKIPTDLVPYWDYDAPSIPNEPRDASAAAITASALLELASLTADTTLAASYTRYATTILTNLSSPAYRTLPGSNHGFLLLHNVGSKPDRSEVDVPLNYADYYYLEGLKRLKN